jgi:mycothione reductase
LQKFDLIVIGSGSGLDVANAATQNGLKVAVIEKDRMSGTCLNRGCIPSKLLIHSADVAEIIKSANLFGIEVDGLSVNFQKIVERVNNITDHKSGQIKNAFKDIENPKLFAKECKFVGEKTILIGDNEKMTAENILIASGTRPQIPKKIKGLEGSSYITSNEALRLKKQPRVITFIGGGYITCELAHFFGSLGTEINIVQLGDALISKEDEEISKKFTEVFSKKYNVYLGYETESVSKRKRNSDNDADSIFQIIAKNSDGRKSLELDSDQLLLAVGRIPNSDILDIEKAGVKVHEKGFIITDDYLETNIKGIFALGDAVGRYQFKHNANHESRYAFNNILHPNRKVAVDYTSMPHAIFSSPQVAGVGFTEQELKKKSIDYQRSVYPYINTGMGEAIEDRDGFVKFLVDGKSRKILGCHIIGSHASILINEVLVAMRVGDGTIDSISRTIHIHPALSEVIARAADEI